MRTTLLAITAIAVTALSGCASPAEETAGTAEGAKVATLTSAAPSASASAASQRPRERLDTTAEEFEAMLKPYNKCMKEHGGYTKDEAATADGPARPVTKDVEAKTAEANRICEPQFMPLPPWEKDPANPEARDFARDVVACLKGRGIAFVAIADDGVGIALGGDRNDARSISKGMELTPECEREVAARHE